MRTCQTTLLIMALFWQLVSNSALLAQDGDQRFESSVSIVSSPNHLATSISTTAMFRDATKVLPPRGEVGNVVVNVNMPDFVDDETLADLADEVHATTLLPANSLIQFQTISAESIEQNLGQFQEYITQLSTVNGIEVSLASELMKEVNASAASIRSEFADIKAAMQGPAPTRAPSLLKILLNKGAKFSTSVGKKVVSGLDSYGDNIKAGIEFLIWTGVGIGMVATSTQGVAIQGPAQHLTAWAALVPASVFVMMLASPIKEKYQTKYLIKATDSLQEMPLRAGLKKVGRAFVNRAASWGSRISAHSPRFGRDMAEKSVGLIKSMQTKLRFLTNGLRSTANIASNVVPSLETVQVFVPVLAWYMLNAWLQFLVVDMTMQPQDRASVAGHFAYLIGITAGMMVDNFIFSLGLSRAKLVQEHGKTTAQERKIAFMVAGFMSQFAGTAMSFTNLSDPFAARVALVSVIAFTSMSWGTSLYYILRGRNLPGLELVSDANGQNPSSSMVELANAAGSGQPISQDFVYQKMAAIPPAEVFGGLPSLADMKSFLSESISSCDKFDLSNFVLKTAY